MRSRSRSPPAARSSTSRCGPRISPRATSTASWASTRSRSAPSTTRPWAAAKTRSSSASHCDGRARAEGTGAPPGRAVVRAWPGASTRVHPGGRGRLGRASRPRRRMSCMRPVREAQAGGFRRGARSGTVAFRGRRPRRGRRRARRALRGAGRQAAGLHARGDRLQARARGLHRQRREVPPAGQSHAHRARGGRMRPVPRPPDRIDQAAAHRGARQDGGDTASRHGSEPREPARQGAPVPRHACHRHLSSGLPAAKPSREGEGVGGPRVRAKDARRRLKIAPRAPIVALSPSQGEQRMRKLLWVFTLLAALVLPGCGYNEFQTKDEQVQAAWAEVLNQYKRRADLIPNLVNTVQGYASHEQNTLTAVINARAKATSVQLPPDALDNPEKVRQFQQAQNELSGALGRLLVVAEQYPNLKADANFRDLQAQLEGTENRITTARNRFIKAVQEYNVLARQFPTNLTAMIFGYKEKPSFTVEDEKSISRPPKVDFTPRPAPAAPPAQPAQPAPAK